METENDSPDELEIVYPTLSRELAPSRACATDDTVPLRVFKRKGRKFECLYSFSKALSHFCSPKGDVFLGNTIITIIKNFMCFI